MTDQEYETSLKKYRYKVQKLSIIEEGKKIERLSIVIANTQTGVIEAITEYGDFCLYSTLYDRKYTQTNAAIFHNVVSFLNFVLIDNYSRFRIRHLEDIRIDIIKDYLVAYAHSKTKQDKAPSKTSVITKRNHISDFLFNACSSPKIKMKNITKEDICEECLTKYNNKHGEKLIKKYKIKVVYDDDISGYRTLNRDMPIGIVDRFIKLAKIYDRELVFPIVLMAYAGLRSGEVVNLRRKTSCYGPSLIIQKPNPDSCEAIDIDLSSELPLRSDGLTVGRIKKERHQSVCPMFVDTIYNAYIDHLALTANKSLEEYAPMFVSRYLKSGKNMALTKSALVSRIRRLFFEHVLPSCENDETLDFRLFYEKMQSRTWGPHSFRHWFTVVLVLMGYDEVQVMSFRGDTSIDSARSYLERKGELQRIYSNANEMLAVIAAKEEN